ncbi:MAG: hypothetical protein F9K19_05080 [Rhizobiaceae bacterium]|nr:MAG: hypothetical protein F9K19_05080 [Rhizobiaceae bacterium]CAG0965062.1 hypothetical protein RHIZO_00910 [Rhizobiaceae bacterium]
MTTRRKKPERLNEREIEAFVAAADDFHRVLVRPLISPHGEHYRALGLLNEALMQTIAAVSGRPAPWLSRSSSPPRKGS